jgi:hypothetical protein
MWYKDPISNEVGIFMFGIQIKKQVKITGIVSKSFDSRRRRRSTIEDLYCNKILTQMQLGPLQKNMVQSYRLF